MHIPFCLAYSCVHAKADLPARCRAIRGSCELVLTAGRRARRRTAGTTSDFMSGKDRAGSGGWHRAVCAQQEGASCRSGPRLGHGLALAEGDKGASKPHLEWCSPAGMRLRHLPVPPRIATLRRSKPQKRWCWKSLQVWLEEAARPGFAQRKADRYRSVLSPDRTPLGLTDECSRSCMWHPCNSGCSARLRTLVSDFGVLVWQACLGHISLRPRLTPPGCNLSL